MALIRLNNQSISSVTALPSGIPTGKVLQTVSDYMTGNGDTVETTSSSFIDTGMSVNITPSSTSSKILLIWNIAVYYFSGDWMISRIMRDSTDISRDIYERNSAGLLQTTGTKILYDTPNTTSQITYKTQYYAVTGTARIGNPHGALLTAIEIGT